MESDQTTVVWGNSLQAERPPPITGDKENKSEIEKWLKDMETLASLCAPLLPSVFEKGTKVGNRSIERIVLVGSGGSHYTANTAVTLLSMVCNTEVVSHHSADVRDLECPRLKKRGTLFVFISRGGESQDTTAAAKRIGIENQTFRVIALTAGLNTTLAENCDIVIPVGNFKFGPVGVGPMLLFLVLFALLAGLLRSIEGWADADDVLKVLIDACMSIPTEKNNYREKAFSIAQSIGPRLSDPAAKRGNIYLVGGCYAKDHVEAVAVCFGRELLRREITPLKLAEMFHGSSNVLKQGDMVIVLASDEDNENFLRLVDLQKKEKFTLHEVPLPRLVKHGCHPKVVRCVASVAQAAMGHNIFEILAGLLKLKIWSGLAELGHK